MRKIFASILTFTMVASAVICGCSHQVQANSDTKSHLYQEDTPHSHEGNDHHDKSSTLAQDCKSADTPLPAYFNISKSDLEKSLHIDYAIVQEIPVRLFNLASNSVIRGPPPWDELSQAKFPIFLTTQRLRI